jgi:predicted dehydrogenase
MPTIRYLKELIERGYLGEPYHLNMRYFSGFGLSGEYLWRMDRGRAGSGVLGDLGSHFVYLAEWFFGEIDEVSCRLATMVERPPVGPDGRPYAPADDTAVIVLGFGNGAKGVIHVSAVAHTETPFGQVHEMDLHGSSGALHAVTDWDRVQIVKGGRVGEDASRELPVPDSIWADAPRDPVKATYHHVFRTQGRMIGEFVAAAAEGRAVRPDFRDGARLQGVLDAALLSHVEGRTVRVVEVTGSNGPSA